MKEFLEIEDGEFDSLFNKITQNVKQIRKEKGITQESLALAIGHTSASMLSKIEAGLEGKHYNIKQLYLIAKFMQIPMMSFFKECDNLDKSSKQINL